MAVYTVNGRISYPLTAKQLREYQQLYAVQFEKADHDVHRLRRQIQMMKPEINTLRTKQFMFRVSYRERLEFLQDQLVGMEFEHDEALKRRKEAATAMRNLARRKCRNYSWSYTSYESY